MTGTIAERLEVLRKEVQDLSLRVHGRTDAVKIVLVSKFVEPARILEAYQAGVRDFGENRVQELEEKMDQLPPDIRWHMIGRLQTNKVKYLMREGVVLIQSLDRADLALELERQAAKKNRSEVPCLIQVNSSGEPQKGGLPLEEVEAFVRSLSDKSPIKVQGLMTVGPETQDLDLIRKSFRSVKALAAELKGKFPQKNWGTISMGMSADYRIAIEEGANLIRVGSLVFGARPNTEDARKA